MTKKEYLEQVSGKSIDWTKVERMQKRYRAELPGIFQKILSNGGETIFLDNGNRILSYDEILNAEQELHLNFKEKGMVPLADCGENDFIVYHFREGMWSKFNIIDETVFKKRGSVGELL